MLNLRQLRGAIVNLFRPEAVDHMDNRLYGDIVISIPVGWQVIGYLIFGSAIVAALFLSLGTYTHVELARGTIVPESGVLEIVPPTAGIVLLIPVKNGELVRAHQPLAWIRPASTEEMSPNARRDLIKNLDNKNLDMNERREAGETSVAAELARIDAQRSTLAAQASQLALQLQLQKRLVQVADIDFLRAEEVARRGFVSHADLQKRERALIEARQREVELAGAKTSNLNDIAANHALRRQRTAQLDSEAAVLRAEQADLERQIIRLRAAEAYSLNSPVDGIVTALGTQPGAKIDGRRAVMVVVPANARLQANLSIPQEAIGFVSAGQSVKLMIDAFPYDTYGTIDGRVVEVSSAPGDSGNRSVARSYVAKVELSRTSIDAFGQQRRLLPGMELRARITTRRETLIRWLFRPLFAVSKR